MSRSVLAVVPAILLGACSVVGIRSGTEEPPYTVLAKLGTSVEVRQYGPRLAAETVETGEEKAALRAGFQRLAGYIFGKNTRAASIAMTAPVTQEAAGSAIAMTAPVTSERAGEGAWRIRFFMPASYTTATLPKPTDKKIEIVTIPGEAVAVYRYSGVASVRRQTLAHREVLGALGGSTWLPRGDPVDWFYDPPWTLPPLRRNEAAVTVEQPG